VGASHQTGWSGLVALLLQPRVMAASGNVPLAGEAEQASVQGSGSTPAHAPAVAHETAAAMAATATK
jgi:hypothetical protein